MAASGARELLESWRANEPVLPDQTKLKQFSFPGASHYDILTSLYPPPKEVADTIGLNIRNLSTFIIIIRGVFVCLAPAKCRLWITGAQERRPCCSRRRPRRMRIRKYLARFFPFLLRKLVALLSSWLLARFFLLLLLARAWLASWD